MWLHRLLCLLLGLEDYIARGIIDPFYSEMRIDMEIISDELIAHVIYPKQVPHIWS